MLKPLFIEVMVLISDSAIARTSVYLGGVAATQETREAKCSPVRKTARTAILILQSV